MVDIAEVAGGSNQVLDKRGVDNVTDDGVDESADASFEAVGDVIDTHVGSADGGPVADLALDGAALKDVTSEKGALGEAHHVDLVDGELGVSEQLGASLVGLVLEVVGDGGDGTVTDLDAGCVVTSLLLDAFGETVHAWIDAGIAKTVEDGGGDGRNGSHS